MHFLLIAYDGTDDQAPQRRLAVRERHLASMQKLKAEGRALFGSAMLNDQEKMIGSILIYDFDSRDDLDRYLKNEPYVTGKVWQSIEIKPCRVPPLFLDK